MKQFTYRFKNGVLSVFVSAASQHSFRGFEFIVDTGASDSIISRKAAKLLGFDVDAITDVGAGLYSASGIIHPKLLTLTAFKALGRLEQDFRIRVVDFPDDTEGVLGIDFISKFGWFKINFPDDIRAASIEVGEGLKGHLRLFDIADIVKKVVMRLGRRG